MVEEEEEEEEEEGERTRRRQISPATDQEPLVSSQWSRYQRGKKIGSGGYSRVYECVDKETGVERVCKVMSDGNEYNFHKELKILSMLQVLLLQLSFCSMPLLLLMRPQFATSARSQPFLNVTRNHCVGTLAGRYKHYRACGRSEGRVHF